MNNRTIPTIKTNPMEDFVKSNQETICELPLSRIVPFSGHTFRVRDDEDMKSLEESIKANGISEPIIVRPVNGNYEIISGHRRCFVARKLGFEFVPGIVREINDDDATILMVDANCHRSGLLPSEKAKSYMAKYKALVHKGSKGENTLDRMEAESGDKAKTIQRYLRLTKLSEEMLNLVDDKRIGFIPAVVLADLNEEEQSILVGYLNKNEKKKISVRQAKELASCSKEKVLSKKKIENVLSAKPRAKNVLHVDLHEIKKFFPEADDESLSEIVIEAVKLFAEAGGHQVSN